MNRGNIFWNPLKGRCIETCEGQTLTKMSNMWAARSEEELIIVGMRWLKHVPNFFGERRKILFANNTLESRHKFFIHVWGCSNGRQNPSWPRRYDDILGHPAICLQPWYQNDISNNKHQIPCWCTLYVKGHIHCLDDLMQAPLVLVLRGEGQHAVNI